jgi:hypothetical protein
MTRHTAPRVSRAQDSHTHAHTQPTATSRCVLGCVDSDGKTRPAMKKGTNGLCSVCDKRIDRQASMPAAWRAQWQSIYTARLAGFDYIPSRRR